MTDNPFTSAFESQLRTTQADRIAAERVTTLRPDMEARQRALSGLQALEAALSQLEMVADEVALNSSQIQALSDAESRLALLVPRVKLRKSLIHLVSEMGRPAP